MQLSDKDFYTLWGAALETADRDIYVSEWSTSSIFPEEADLLKIADYVGEIWDVAHMSVRDICKAAKLSQAALATKFCIPLRTVEAWCMGERRPTDYDRLMMVQILGLINRD